MELRYVGRRVMGFQGTLVLALGVLMVEATVPGPRCPPSADCQEKYNVTGDFVYHVEGKMLKLSYFERQSFKLTCPRNVSLESASMPRFEELTDFEHVVLQQCALPSKGLAHALAQLRVQPRDTLELLDVPAVGALTTTHIAGLSVRSLKLEGDGSLTAEEDSFSVLAQQKEVRLRSMRLEPAALLSLPIGLESLWLTNTALQTLPREVLARLPALRYLQLSEPRLRESPELDAAIALAVLVLRAPLVDRLVVGPALENATLQNMNLTSITGDCALRRLTVLRARAVTELSPCARLRSVSLVQSVVPPRDLLRGLTELRELSFKNSQLRELPSGLFAASAQLERLDLTNTGLRAPALAALEPFTALEELSLMNNRLGDLCRTTATYLINDMSPLRSLRKLRILRLVGTGATRVCRDWRDGVTMPALQLVDLSRNNITELGAAEAMWPRGTLDVRQNPLRSVLYTPADYERALAAPPASPTASVLVDDQHSLTCDCLVYWFARALRERPLHAHPALAKLRCAPPPAPSPAARPAPALVTMPLESLECAVPREECAPGCACAVNGERSVLRCAGGELTALPAPPAGLPPPRALYVANNNITSLPSDIPPEITLLDVRDNAVAELPLETWSALLEGGRRLMLAGNQLNCGCDQRAALTLLKAHADQLDAGNITCVDGRALLALRPDEDCLAPRPPLAALLGALLGAVLLAALTVLACLARPASRRWIKRFLVKHNLCLKLLLRPDRVEGKGETDVEGEGAELAYDVFVSFSHHDHKFVAEDLVPHLEGAARPRRLCLHYRDWTPGEWIPTQISESVRRSRRTLVVVSTHFLQSQWARAEFRAAHALALRSRHPRLVVLLLAPSATLTPRADPELTAFLANNTYLCRDDPRFWDKLLDALPASASPTKATPSERTTPPEKYTAPCA